jgi:hypothetical protein
MSIGFSTMNIGHGFVAMRRTRRPRFEDGANPVADVWPEVSSHYPQEEMDRAAAENSPGRVFLEIFLVLGVAVLMAIAAAIWVPILS